MERWQSAELVRRLTVLVVTVTGVACAADRPEIGVMAGYSLTPPATFPSYFDGSFACGSSNPGQVCGSFWSAGRRPLLGFSVFLPLTKRIALRASPLYQNVSISELFVNPPANGTNITYTDRYLTSGNRWELPISVRWRFTQHVNAGVGGTVSTITRAELTDTQIYPTYIYPTGYTGGSTTRVVQYYSGLSRRTIGGATAGVEFPFRTRFIVIAPDVEYTRWASRHYGVAWPLNRVTAGLALRF